MRYSELAYIANKNWQILARLAMKKRKKTQITKIRNESGNNSMNPTVIKKKAAISTDYQSISNSIPTN